MAFGKSNYEKKNTPTIRVWGIEASKDGSPSHNVYRILPANKSLADSGQYRKWYAIHYGYKGTDRMDPSRLKARPFRCIEQKDFKTQIVKQACPECEKIKDMQARLQSKVDTEKALGRTEEEIELATSSMASWLKDHNCDRKWYYSVMNKDGEFGTLKVNGKIKQQIDALVEKLTAKGIDATALDQGVWFDIVRTGRMLKAVDIVEIVKTSRVIDGEVLESTKLAPLTLEQAEKGSEECMDLGYVSTLLTEAQIQALVNSSGDKDEVDAIFDSAQTRREASPVTERPVIRKEMPAAIGSLPQLKDPVVAAPVAAPVVVAPVAAAAPVVASLADADEEELERQLAAKRAARAAAAAAAAQAAAQAAPTVVAAPAPVATPVAPVVDVGVDPTKLSDDAFASLFGGQAVAG
jgi:hypothetical protein